MDIKINHFGGRPADSFIYRVERIADETVPERPAGVLYGKFGEMIDPQKGWLENNIRWTGTFVAELPVEVAQEVLKLEIA